ncbi:cocaine- and amphetamine-regulated transcript protein-like [Syngnathoides biaculeatus]|uniref:cocaine- and amphetamine-regulated transcript protein-like n=1 Tax=Syngnathoides biaculeatus TaxID=300417 RepID=UPI002ADD8EA7|nr:cocaine- and amphetamine-regulated transcript protein-like [Syngnathoides biaculeatus]
MGFTKGHRLHQYFSGLLMSEAPIKSEEGGGVDGARKPRHLPANAMFCTRAFLLLAAAAFLCAVSAADEASTETRSLDFTLKSQQEKELIDALQEVLEKLRSKEIPSEKKLGWLPSCDAGEPCAVRKGSRIGTLCSCPRGTFCNFYVLKCL